MVRKEPLAQCMPEMLKYLRRMVWSIVLKAGQADSFPWSFITFGRTVHIKMG